MAKVVIPIGLPGCGKSTLINSVPLSPREVVLSLDRFRKTILGHQYRLEAEPLVHSWVDVTGRYLIAEGYTVIVDATNLTRSLRERWCRLAQEYKASVSYVFFGVPEEVCRSNNRHRDKSLVVPEVAFERMVAQFERPTDDEPWHKLTVVEYDGKGGFKQLPSRHK